MALFDMKISVRAEVVTREFTPPPTPHRKAELTFPHDSSFLCSATAGEIYHSSSTSGDRDALGQPPGQRAVIENVREGSDAFCTWEQMLKQDKSKVSD
ncbi:hypothetical protein CEXT_83921 [Caerostris extrusa]|uniref:Uncharacterized protein n=1 Tax=Caerostris extrusa TaxID=172846 RepID=A0AAV4QZM6_CAEEX|nr:hypothetical protein CEXT_83921 [Caerostris extrusa]